MSVESGTERVLRLLALLQRRPAWTALDLATELGVTDRSVRRDVERLRRLGYPVQATPGVGGGYRLGAGARLPPLLLDEEEAVATAVALRLVAGGGIAGAGEAALRALARLDQVMPPRLRERVAAVHGATETLTAPGAVIDADLLVLLARACRDRVRVRFRHTRPGRPETDRTVEPLRLVTTGRLWYLVAFDVDRDDWRTFRLDRVRRPELTGWRCRPREHPDPVALVRHAVTEAPYRVRARIRLHAPAAEVRDRVPVTVGRVDPDPDAPADRCVLTIAAEHPDWILAHTARLGVPAEVLEPEELRAAAAAMAATLTALSTGSVPPSS
ncbi:WYL domain-containing protein [Kineococcus sp. NPDC059986]|uniref:helix-turn-helix transcriptional regulator n=1 Tax=Kineococcus sp. NPDC059986 TaxID=3155538 RepID=UPI00344E7D83